MGNKIAGILGYGETGHAYASLYEAKGLRRLIKDINSFSFTDWEEPNNVHYLHVCIPFVENYVGIVSEEIKQLPNLEIVFIHTTCKPGTTGHISARTKIPVVHVPIRGDHENMAEHLKIFHTYVGVLDNDAGTKAERYLTLVLGLKTFIMMPPETTELAKLLDTTYYGMCIAFHGEAKKLCDEYGVNFFDAITTFNMSYNMAYTKAGKPNVVRPVLFPPQDNIGGHCIVPNVEILKEVAQYCQTSALEDVLNLILKYKKEE